MKTLSTITILAMLLILLAAWRTSYRDGYMDGYHHRQLEALPEIGIETHKEPAAGLLGKG